MKKAISLLAAALLLTVGLTGCGGKDANTIVVAASSTPHAEILENVKDTLAEKGYTLQVKVYDDYVLPNIATEEGDVDANYFQHTPYLNSFNKDKNTHLISVGSIHYEPYGIYRGTAASLSALKDGDKIAVPNDPTNEARALQLLAAQGLFTLKEGVGLAATKQDIVDNPHKYDIVEMEAAVIPSCLDSVGVAVINGNYAINAGLKVKDALALEDKNSEAAQTYANILAVKEGQQDNEGIRLLVEALKSDKTKAFIEEKYAGAVVAVF